MDIRNWSLDQIMQLPDQAFGARWPIGGELLVGAGATVWTVSDQALPEVAVMWELVLVAFPAAATRDVFRIALGDQIPTATAEMDVLQPVFPGLGIIGPQPRAIHLREPVSVALRNLRLPIRTAGRRLVVEFTNTGASTDVMTCWLVVSSVPREIPDCLFSV